MVIASTDPIIIALTVALVCLSGIFGLTVLSFKRALRVAQMRANEAYDVADRWFHEHNAVRARLNKFTAPRKRNEKGHYLSERAQ